MQLTDLLAKPLIHLSEAKTLGNVYGFWTDKHFKRIRYIEALDEETYAHPAAYSWGKVHVGLDAVCVSTDPETPEGVFVPFKGTIYDTDGRQKTNSSFDISLISLNNDLSHPQSGHFSGTEPA